MRKEFTSLIMSLHLLLLMRAELGNGAREVHGGGMHLDQDQLISIGDGNIHNHFWLQSIFEEGDNHNCAWLQVELNDLSDKVDDHDRYTDPTLREFVDRKDLKLGKRLPIYFQKIRFDNPSTDPNSPHLLTKKEADSIPFSYQEFPKILKLLSVPEGSPQAKSMEQTLHICDAKTIKGEIKVCVTSLESMYDFVKEILGPKFKILATNHLTKEKVGFQNYTIQENPEFVVVNQEMVACHALSYPYVVFYCHRPDEGRPFKVSLIGDNGDRTESVGVCHENTSEWSPKHVAFGLLGTKPGAEVCHFLSADNLLFLPVK